MKNEYEKIIEHTLASVIKTLKEMKQEKEGSEGLYIGAKEQKDNSFDNGYDFAVALLESSLEGMKQ